MNLIHLIPILLLFIEFKFFKILTQTIIPQIQSHDDDDHHHYHQDQGFKFEEVGDEVITCHQDPIQVKRSTILEFIQSFCDEVEGLEFGNQNHQMMKERYTITSSQSPTSQSSPSRLVERARFVELELRSINGCRFSVDESCGRYLTRPTDECNIGEEEKQGGWVTDGCSLWIATPLI